MVVKIRMIFWHKLPQQSLIDKRAPVKPITNAAPSFAFDFWQPVIGYNLFDHHQKLSNRFV